MRFVRQVLISNEGRENVGDAVIRMAMAAVFYVAHGRENIVYRFYQSPLPKQAYLFRESGQGLHGSFGLDQRLQSLRIKLFKRGGEVALVTGTLSLQSRKQAGKHRVVVGRRVGRREE